MMVCTNNLNYWQDQVTGEYVRGPSYGERVNIIGRVTARLMCGAEVVCYTVAGYDGAYWSAFFKPIGDVDAESTTFEEKHGKTKEKV